MMIQPSVRLTTTVQGGRLMFSAIRMGADANAPDVVGIGGTWNEALAALENALILEYQNGQRPPSS